jgi:hypothetical protein
VAGSSSFILNLRKNIMLYALCTAYDRIYSAIEFARLPADQINLLRRLLRCPECNEPGFFHNSSYDGRVPPFFGASPHKFGCSQASQEPDTSGYSAPDVMDKVLYQPGGKIVVNFNFGAFAQQEYDEENEPESILNSTARNHRLRNRLQASFYRCLKSLLRLLVNSIEFRNSSKHIEVHGNSEITVADFFVPLLDVTERYLGCYRGYWGLLSDMRQKEGDNTVWFNSGGKDNVSFCMNSSFMSEFYQRYPFRDPEDIAGKYILVIGLLREAPNKKFYCEIVDPAFMALR